MDMIEERYKREIKRREMMLHAIIETSGKCQNMVVFHTYTVEGL